MLKLILKRLYSNLNKTYLTFIAIILAIFFLSGSLIMRNSIKNAILISFSSESKESDLVVIDSDLDSGTENLITPKLIDQVNNVSGVKGTRSYVTIRNYIKINNELVESTLSNINDNLHIIKGKKPTNDTQVLIDNETYKKNHFKLGDKITSNRDTTYEITGVFEKPALSFRSGGTPQLATLDSGLYKLSFDDDTEHHIYKDIFITLKNKKQISSTKKDIDNTVNEFNQSLKDTGKYGNIKYKTITTAKYNKIVHKRTTTIINKITYAMLVFAILASCISAILIFNTFKIIFLQDQKFFGLLRCIGVSKKRIITINLIYFIFLGIISSIIGIMLGSIFPKIFYNFYNKFASTDSISTSIINSFSLTKESIIISVLFGIFLTLLSGIIPAVRVSNVSPVNALKDINIVRSSDSAKRFNILSKLRIILSLLMFVGIFLLYILNDHLSKNKVVALSFLFIIAFLLIYKYLVYPLIKFINYILYNLFGRLIKSFGKLFYLALSNIKNNRNRISSNTITLTIMTFLIVSINVFIGSGLKYAYHSIDEAVPYEYNMSISSLDAYNNIINKVKEINHFNYVDVFTQEAFEGDKLPQIEKGGGMSTMGFVVGSATSSSDINKLQDHLIKVVQGNINDVHDNNIAVNIKHGGEGEAGVTADYKIGDQIKLISFSDSKVHTYKIVALFKGTGDDRGNMAKSGMVAYKYIVSTDIFNKYYISQDKEHSMTHWELLLNRHKNIKNDTLANKQLKNICNTYHDYYDYCFYNSAKDQKDALYSKVVQIKNIITGLLIISIVVSLFGIATIVTLSTLERKRELSLLRILGLTKGQMYFTLIIESTLMSLFSIITGIIIALLLSYMNIKSLLKGATEFVIPYNTVMYMLLVAFVIGVLSAILPAINVIRNANVHNVD